MSDNGGFGPASARMLLVASSLVVVVSLAMPWFGQYGDYEAFTELTHQWSGWGLAGESRLDDHVALDVFAVIPMVLAVGALPFLACLAGPGPRQRRLTEVATGLGVLLFVFSWWLGFHASGEYGDSDHLVEPLFGLSVFRVAVFAYVCAAARLAWLAGLYADRYEQHA